MPQKQLACQFPESFAEIIRRIPANVFCSIEEIRLRIGKPLTVSCAGLPYFLSTQGVCTADGNAALVITQAHVASVLARFTGHAMYAFEEAIKNGYVTLAGGHRVGVAGTCVVDAGAVKTIRNIAGLNVRVAHEVKGCANGVLPFIGDANTMVIAPPGAGKTTLLRDIVRQESNGVCGTVKTSVVVDERSEIAACAQGVPQLDVGTYTDVLDACPKAAGMMMAIRSLAPKLIVVDEVATAEDALALENAVGSGVQVVCTLHGEKLDVVWKKPFLERLLKRKVFERFVILGKDRAATVFNDTKEVLGTCLC
jgi:stage III sporulation protein AA